jgi:hypothetical protein
LAQNLSKIGRADLASSPSPVGQAGKSYLVSHAASLPYFETLISTLRFPSSYPAHELADPFFTYCMQQLLSSKDGLCCEMCGYR